MDIGQWLRGLGLRSYQQAFRDNGVDFDVLRHPTNIAALSVEGGGTSTVGTRL